MENRRSRILLGMAAALFIGAEYSHEPFLELHIHGLGVSVPGVGLVIACYILAELLVERPVREMAANGVSAKLMAVCACLLTTVCTVGLIFAKTGTAAALCRILGGLSAALWSIVIRMADVYEEIAESGHAVSLAVKASDTGMLAALVIGTAAAAAGGHEMPLYVSLAMGIGSVICTLCVKNVPVNVGERADALRAFRIPGALRICLSAAVTQFAVHGTAFAFTSIILEEKGFSLLQIGLAVTITAAAEILLEEPVEKLLMHRLGERWSEVLGYLLIAVSPLLIISTESAAAVYAAQLIAGIGLALTELAVDEHIVGLPDEIRGSVDAAERLSGRLGTMAGFILIGAMAAGGHFHRAYTVTAALSVAAAIAALLPYRKEN